MRHGRCLPYGSSIVYWPLGEVIRAECAIIDGDPPEAAWEKLSARLGALLGGPDSDSRSSASKTAVVGRLLGIEGPDDPALGDQQDAQQAREVFFAAVRSCVEGLARDRPLVLVWEDIHWADEGMLDLIEHLVQWVRAPVLQICLAREELLDRRAGWGGVRRDATTMFLEPLGDSETRELIASLMRSGGLNESVVAAVAARAEGNPLFVEEMVRRLSEEEGASAAELPATVQAVLAARLDSLEPFQRRLLAHAAVIGRTFWEGALTPIADAEGHDLDEALRALRDKDIVVAGEGSALAGEPELAFKHALIRDAAYEMLPKAVRAQKHFEVARFIEVRAGERVEEVVALLAEHYGKAAELGGELGLSSGDLAPYRAKALTYLEAAGDAATAFYSNADAFSDYQAALELTGSDAEAVARLLEKQGDVALRLGRVDAAIGVWERALDHHSGREDLEHVAELHRKIGAGLAHKGERKQAIEHHQRGINLIKDGEPSLALVRLYEEAAWLYMQTGDNMLAIYASEKALRLAERLGEVRAASRAHGIFGRVFGRIGDTVKARENLERAVELARGSDAHETVLALMALGHQLESSDADYTAAADSYREALALARQIGDVPAEIELLAAVGQLALYAADWEQVQSASDASAELSEREGLIGKLCLPYALRGRLHWRDGDWQASETSYTARARARRADRLVRGRLRRAVRALEHAARPGRAAGRRDRALPGARNLRTRRPDRAIDSGQRSAGAPADARRPAREGQRSRAGGDRALRARAQPRRRGSGDRSRRRRRSAAGGARQPAAGARGLASSRAPAGRRPLRPADRTTTARERPRGGRRGAGASRRRVRRAGSEPPGDTCARAVGCKLAPAVSATAASARPSRHRIAGRRQWAPVTKGRTI